MITRLPDKPFLRPARCLPHLDKDYCAQLKYDGHRCVVEIDKEIRFFSRHAKPLHVCDDVKNAIRRLNFPNGTALDTEWMGPHRASVPTEYLGMIGLLWYEGNWLGGLTERTRFSMMYDVMDGKWSNLVREIPFEYNDYVGLFDRAKLDPTTEGIVLKHHASKLVGNTDKSAKNMLWSKVKYRT